MDNRFECTPEETLRAVYVSNLAKTTTVQKISEFFSFCGKITRLVLRGAADNTTQEALVVFEIPSAAKTALLLKDALIEGHAIQVIPESERVPDHSHHPETVTANLNDQRYQQESPDGRTSTSVIASLIASGYTLGNNAAAKAVDLDKEFQISGRASEAWNSVTSTVSHTVTGLDDRFAVSATANSWWNSAAASVTPFIAQVTPLVNTVSEAATNAATSAMENPYVKSVADSANSSIANLQASVQQVSNDISEEANRRIAEEELRSGHDHGHGHDGPGWDGGNVQLKEGGQEGGQDHHDDLI